MKMNFEKKTQSSVIALLLATLLILLWVVLILINHTTKQTLPGVAFQYIHDQKYELDTDTKMRLMSDGSYRFIMLHTEVTPDHSPLYIQDQPSFMVLYDYILVDPYTAKQSYVESKSTYIIENEKINRYIDETCLERDVNGLLFDGQNTYITLEPTVIKYMDKTIELTAFSFIEVTPNEYIRIYNYGTDEMLMTILTTKTQFVSLTNTESSYQIDLYFDALVAAQGQEILLFTSPLNLKGQK